MHNLGRKQQAENHSFRPPMRGLSQFIQTHKKTNATLVLALWVILIWTYVFLIG